MPEGDQTAMIEPPASEPWNGSNEHPIRIEANRRATGALLFHTARHL